MDTAVGAAVVEFRNVCYRLDGRLILDNLSFTVPAGQTLVLLGRSGSGKTTALKMVNGLLFPTSGEVLVEGRPTTAWDLIKLRRSIGYVIQEVGSVSAFHNWRERGPGAPFRSNGPRTVLPLVPAICSAK